MLKALPKQPCKLLLDASTFLRSACGVKKVVATPLCKMEQDSKSSQIDAERLLVKGITQYERLVGSGHFGKVFEVKYYGTACAAKEIQAEALREKELESFKDQYIQQCCKYSMLRHPNIVQFLGICNTLNHAQPLAQEANDEANLKEAPDEKAAEEPQIPFATLTELMASNLTSLLEQHEDIPLHVKLSILYDVSLGLNFLHAQTPAFVHGRLYSNNILLSAQLVAKIGDLEFPQLAKSSIDTPSPGIGDFMPPKSEDTGTPVDAFSYGGVILHTITQQWPLPIENEASESAAPLQVDRRKKYLEKISGELKLLTISCLDDDPKSRPTAGELVESVMKVKNERKSPFADMNTITWLAEVDTLSGKLEDALLELEEANQLLTQHEELIDRLQVSYNILMGETDNLQKFGNSSKFYFFSSNSLNSIKIFPIQICHNFTPIKIMCHMVLFSTTVCKFKPITLI